MRRSRRRYGRRRERNCDRLTHSGNGRRGDDHQRPERPQKGERLEPRGAKASLLDQFDYAMHGTVYKFQHVKDTKVEVYVSHGGLLARFRGDQRHLKKLKVDAEVYTLLRKGSA